MDIMKEKLHLSGGNKVLFYLWGILFAVAFFVFVLSLSIKATFLNPQYYKDNLKKVDAYTRIINDGIPSLLLTVQISDDQLTDSLAKEVATILIQKAIDPAWLESMTDTFINKTVEFLRNPNESVSLNLTDFNTTLEKVSKSLLVLEELIPGCKDVTAAKASSNKTVAKAASLIPATLDCTDSSESLDEIKKDIGGIREKIDLVNLNAIQVGQIVSDANTFLQKIRSFIKEVNVYFWASLVSLMVLILGYFIVKRDDILGALQRASFVGAISAFLTLVIGFIAGQVTPQTLGNEQVAFSPAMKMIANDVVKSLVSGFFQYFEVCALVVLVASIILYVVVLLTKTNRHITRKH